MGVGAFQSERTLQSFAFGILILIVMIVQSLIKKQAAQ